MITNLDDFCISKEKNLREVINFINRNHIGIVLVTDESHRLLDAITDGDMRRAFLANESLDTRIDEWLPRKVSALDHVVTVPVGTAKETILQVMQKNMIRQVPVLDGDFVVGLVTMDEFVSQQTLPIQAVIMAGGYGTRLLPLTKDIPKPMLPVGDRPLMEHTIEKLLQAGIKHVSISTYYLQERIKEHFGNGESFGLEISYVSEEQPLGTAGALGLMKLPDEPLLVLNGDILTQVDFRAMLDFHQKQKANLTVGVRQYEMEVPYGVLECDGPKVIKLSEKPRHVFWVNAGIYLLDSSVHSYIPIGQKFNMTDLIDRLVEENLNVVSFPILEYWLDIGQQADYERAQKDFQDKGV